MEVCICCGRWVWVWVLQPLLNHSAWNARCTCTVQMLWKDVLQLSFKIRSTQLRRWQNKAHCCFCCGLKFALTCLKAKEQNEVLFEHYTSIFCTFKQPIYNYIWQTEPEEASFIILDYINEAQRVEFRTLSKESSAYNEMILKFIFHTVLTVK